jgi:hypothetical protein
MYTPFLTAVAMVMAFAAPAPTQNAEPKKAKSSAEAIIETLHSNQVQLGEMNLNEIPCMELLPVLSKRHGLTFIIMDKQFEQQGVQNILERRSPLTTVATKGLSLHRFLGVWLASLDATYLVRGDYVEIVPLGLVANAGPMAARPAAQLVSLVVKEKPFNEVVDRLAEQYDLSIVIAPQAGDARTGYVNARLTNLPPETALELLALQNDLRVVRKGAAFLITSHEHVDALFNERVEKERARIELEKFRQAPPPKAEAPRLKPDQPLILKLDVAPTPKAPPKR